VISSNHFFHDNAMCTELGSSPEPINILILGPKGSGKESLLANLRSANIGLTHLFPTPASNAVTAKVKARVYGPAHLRWHLNVDNVRLKAFHTGASQSLLMLRHRLKLKQYLAACRTGEDARIPFTYLRVDAPVPFTYLPWQGRVRGVLFLVNLYAGLDEALEAMRSLMRIRDLRGLPFAVLFHRLDEDGDEGPKMSEEEDAKMLEWYESMWRDAGPRKWPWKVFIGSVKERRGYMEAFRWIMQTEPWEKKKGG
jgi:hypothetical protein